MSTQIETLAEHALRLPANLRAQLAELLLESLDFEEDFPVSAAWREEIERRCKAIDHGEVELIPAQDALFHLRGKYA